MGRKKYTQTLYSNDFFIILILGINWYMEFYTVEVLSD